MLDTSARLLRVLTLLQSRRDWRGDELAERLEVTTRTVRKDVERLRSLGYQVEARPGAAGGYRLGAGGSLPPLLLDDDEAVAIAVGLRAGAGGTIAGLEDASMRALLKLEQVLPARMRHRVGAFRTALTVPTRSATVDPETLTTVAAAARDGETLRFDYTGHDRETRRRHAEPHRLVHHRGRWYLVAWDLDRDDWRTFRVDRLRPRTPNGPRFSDRPLPSDAEIIHALEKQVGEATWQVRARVIVHATAEHVRTRIPIPVSVEELEGDRCMFEPGSDDVDRLAQWLCLLDADFEVVDSDPLRDALTRLAARLRRAAGERTASGPADTGPSDPSTTRREP
jgi:predicted DNA-binding transcriptional regulator YafY